MKNVKRRTWIAIVAIATLFWGWLLFGCSEDPQPIEEITIEGHWIEEVQSGMNYTDKPATWLVITADSIFREDTDGSRLHGAAYELGEDDLELTLVGLVKNQVQALTVPCPEDPAGYTLFPNLVFQMELSWNPDTGELQGQTFYETDEPLFASECTEDPHESVAWDSTFKKAY